MQKTLFLIAKKIGLLKGKKLVDQIQNSGSGGEQRGDKTEPDYQSFVFLCENPGINNDLFVIHVVNLSIAAKESQSIDLLLFNQVYSKRPYF